MVGKLAGGADVIEVAVGEDDGNGRRGEVLFSPVADEGGGVEDASIDERPGGVRVLHSEDIDEGDAEALDAFGDVFDGVGRWRAGGLRFEPYNLLRGRVDLKRAGSIRFRLQCV
jgi:hypothetical protein